MRRIPTMLRLGNIELRVGKKYVFHSQAFARGSVQWLRICETRSSNPLVPTKISEKSAKTAMYFDDELAVHAIFERLNLLR